MQLRVAWSNSSPNQHKARIPPSPFLPPLLPALCTYSTHIRTVCTESANQTHRTPPTWALLACLLGQDPGPARAPVSRAGPGPGWPRPTGPGSHHAGSVSLGGQVARRESTSRKGMRTKGRRFPILLFRPRGRRRARAVVEASSRRHRCRAGWQSFIQVESARQQRILKHYSLHHAGARREVIHKARTGGDEVRGPGSRNGIPLMTRHLRTQQTILAPASALSRSLRRDTPKFALPGIGSGVAPKDTPPRVPGHTETQTESACCTSYCRSGTGRTLNALSTEGTVQSAEAVPAGIHGALQPGPTCPCVIGAHAAASIRLAKVEEAQCTYKAVFARYQPRYKHAAKERAWGDGGGTAKK